ncbi:putative CBF1-interacting co-repressor CIR domain, pre-mRNA splicing factor [Helianthus debilis subsp. tardiflorus]
MGMKFLNKKGWHTGSLRNIENVWKAEQKHEAEQKKLEELRKQIHEEREKAEFRQLQEQAGLVPRQERLDFLYDSGLSVGKGSSDGGFKALESFPAKAEPEQPSASTKPSAPGALFEDKPQSANDAWRKLHSDPLLMIKQREQEALARVKNNPVQMAMIRKSVEAKKHKEKASDGENRKEKHHRKKSKHEKHHSSSSKHCNNSDDEERSISPRHGSKYKNNDHYRTNEHERENRSDSQSAKRDRDDRRHNEHYRMNAEHERENRSDKRDREDARHRPPTHPNKGGSNGPPKRLSKEERAAKLKEMQMDAELHEEQRWRRLKQAAEDDAKEVSHASSSGRNFLDAAHKSVYGADKGGSSTIEESVRRRTHYSQRREEGNAFRR